MKPAEYLEHYLRPIPAAPEARGESAGLEALSPEPLLQDEHWYPEGPRTLIASMTRLQLLQLIEQLPMERRRGEELSAIEFLRWRDAVARLQHDLRAREAQARTSDRLLEELGHAKLQAEQQAAALQQQAAALQQQAAALQHQLAQHAALLAQLRASYSYRIGRTLTLPVRAFYILRPYLQQALRDPAWGRRKLQQVWALWRSGGTPAIKGALVAAQMRQPLVAEQDYQAWIKAYDTPDEAQLQAMRARSAELRDPPLISVVVPAYNPDEGHLRAAIESVRAQAYPHWELCIADDASTKPHVRRVLQEYAALDERIKVVYRQENGHISAASNSALELARGEFVALLDHDDILPPHALYCVAEEILAHPEAALIYSDEDKIDREGRRFDPYFKSDWNPDLFLSHNMISHLGVYRTALLREIGGFRVGYEGSQDYDLALRVVERIRPEQIRHIPRVLYHWRVVPGSTAGGPGEKPYAIVSAQKAIGEFVARRGREAEVLDAPGLGGMSRVRYALPEPAPLVSLIIPTRNRFDLLFRCLESIFQKTEYPNYELIIVDNGSDEETTLRYLQYLEESGKARVLRAPGRFNFSALNNRAAAEARGELLGLLNNDLEVIGPDWLTEMVGHALRPEIGAVGARLWYPDHTLQHGGVILGIGGIGSHAHKGLPRGAVGYLGKAALIQDFSAVTAACMLTRKQVYEEVGGLDEVNLTVAYNDIDYCLRLGARGYRILWTPYAELYHHESASRGYDHTEREDAEKRARFEREMAYMRERWGELLQHDPYYSPNLTLDREDFSLAWPPRLKPLV